MKLVFLVAGFFSMFCTVSVFANESIISIDPSHTTPNQIASYSHVDEISITTTFSDDWSVFDSLPETQRLAIFANGEHLPETLIKLIAELEKVQRISFEETELSELTFLNGFKDLKSLSFNASMVHDASSLKSLDGLETLSFVYSGVDENSIFLVPDNLFQLTVDRSTYLLKPIKSAVGSWLEGQLPADGKRELMIIGDY